MILAEILGPDLFVILVVVALLFGSSQLPKLARSLGSAKSEFERGINEGAGSPTTGGLKEDTVTMTRAGRDRLLGRGDESQRANRTPSAATARPPSEPVGSSSSLNSSFPVA